MLTVALALQLGITFGDDWYTLCIDGDVMGILATDHVANWHDIALEVGTVTWFNTLSTHQFDWATSKPFRDHVTAVFEYEYGYCPSYHYDARAFHAVNGWSY